MIHPSASEMFPIQIRPIQTMKPKLLIPVVSILLGACSTHRVDDHSYTYVYQHHAVPPREVVETSTTRTTRTHRYAPSTQQEERSAILREEDSLDVPEREIRERFENDPILSPRRKTSYVPSAPASPEAYEVPSRGYPVIEPVLVDVAGLLRKRTRPASIYSETRCPQPGSSAKPPKGASFGGVARECVLCARPPIATQRVVCNPSIHSSTMPLQGVTAWPRYGSAGWPVTRGVGPVCMK